MTCTPTSHCALLTGGHARSEGCCPQALRGVHLLDLHLPLTLDLHLARTFRCPLRLLPARLDLHLDLTLAPHRASLARLDLDLTSHPHLNPPGRPPVDGCVHFPAATLPDFCS